jgi:NAD(P)-dependent dehydrogenase (short-subunit alcohol dehydrogenase family)
VKVCIVGASGKLGQYMVEHARERAYEVVGVCRPESVGKLHRFNGRITVVPLKALVRSAARSLARLARFADLNDQVEACRRVFASDTRLTVVRRSDLEEGESQGLPVWSRHVGDPILESNLTRRVDFALFMVDALENDELIHEAPAIVGRLTPSALAHASE